MTSATLHIQRGEHERTNQRVQQAILISFGSHGIVKEKVGMGDVESEMREANWPTWHVELKLPTSENLRTSSKDTIRV